MYFMEGIKPKVISRKLRVEYKEVLRIIEKVKYDYKK